jgi:hypothetical protein
MTLQFHATYRAGAIHPDQPLGLPDNTQVNVTVVPVSDIDKRGMVAEIELVSPEAPRFTADELRERLGRSPVRVGSLPPDFSREDIYNDHD